MDMMLKHISTWTPVFQPPIFYSTTYFLLNHLFFTHPASHEICTDVMSFLKMGWSFDNPHFYPFKKTNKQT